MSNRDKIVVWKSMFYAQRVSLTAMPQVPLGSAYLSGTPSFIVTTPDRVSCGKYTCARVEHGRDTRFRDGDSLLLHRFVDRDTVLVAHLVELVDTDDTRVGQDHCAAFQVELPLT